MRNPEPDKGKSQNQELYPPGVATWPHPGRENTAKAAETRLY